jgi:hypothetical protein
LGPWTDGDSGSAGVSPARLRRGTRRQGCRRSQVHGKSSFAFSACIGTMNSKGFLAARLWSKTQPQRVGCSWCAAAGAAHTAALYCHGYPGSSLASAWKSTKPYFHAKWYPVGMGDSWKAALRWEYQARPLIH